MNSSAAIRHFFAKPEIKMGALVFFGAMVFAVVTRHGWEDYWITFRASKNLALGQGLVFTPGERLHTFTSPLGVLLPAGLSWLTRNHSDALVFWLFRLLSATALAAGLSLIFLTLKTLRVDTIAVWLTLGAIALDVKIIDFTINGMEIGLLVFFTALAIHGLLVAGPSPRLRVGLGWAGMMWTRPDSCVYIAALGLGTWLFLSDKSAVKAYLANGEKLFWCAGVCAIFYLPWFLWAWWYYGTPVPHTVTAKGAGQPPFHAADLLMSLLLFPKELFTSYNISLPFTFLPVYADHGGWFGSYVFLALLAGWCGSFLWLIPGLRPATRMFSLVYFTGNFYLTDVLKYFPPWYLPIVGLFGYLTLGLLFDEVLNFTQRFHWPASPRLGAAPLEKIFRGAVVLILVGQFAVLVCSARQLQVQQSVIEDGMREPIGHWLRAHAASSHDSVTLEPLGYIGYYSGLKMLDYPGLASKEMVQARKRLGSGCQNQAYLELKPDWLVLRPNEARNGTYVDVAGLEKFYERVQVFDVSETIRAIAWLPGRPYLEFDQTFWIFHRKTEPITNGPP